ncbi:hypothetical protein F8M41_006460 [Gigaspora margarita]|uniref:Uncharacterized protein n=1 Tax=Gigaspora margarita TaxID=4874 RepID=A0A8H3X8D9_GIGMA|nr:hypothetical protein F8M41_006460 [Gigaspora margarita]
MDATSGASSLMLVYFGSAASMNCYNGSGLFVPFMMMIESLSSFVEFKNLKGRDWVLRNKHLELDLG